MSYKIENLNGCTTKFSFTFEKLDLAGQIDRALANKQKSVSLKGFRKGKAPMAMVKQLYGAEAENDALNQFVQKEIFDAINKEGLKPVGYPSLANVNYKKGESVSFDATVESFPEFELKPMETLTFTEDKVEVTDEDIEKQKKAYLASKATMVPVEGKALENGHFAILNFQGVKEDGSRPENMGGKEFQLEIGSNQFIPGFEEGMIGMKAGEKKNLDLTFPADYQAEDLKNAKVTFEVELLEIKERQYPEFTDELAKEFGFESVANFETKSRETLLAQKTRQAKEKLHQDMIEKIIDENKFDVPQTMIDQQADYLKRDLTGTLKQQGFDDNMVKEYFARWANDVNTKAVFQVRSGLILNKLAEQFKIEATEKDLDAKIEEAAKASGLDIEQIRNYYTSNEQVKRNLMYSIREEKTFDKIAEIVKIK